MKHSIVLKLLQNDFIPLKMNEILKKIRERPSMYLKDPSVVALYNFLMGWLLGSNNRSEQEILNRFQEYISNKYNVTTSHSWASIIQFYSTDSFHGLELFYREWGEFSGMLPNQVDEVVEGEVE